MKGEHINAEGMFQSDKYPTCPPDKFPMSFKDPMAQDLIEEYAHRRRGIDADLTEDMLGRLRTLGYDGSKLPNDQSEEQVRRWAWDMVRTTAPDEMVHAIGQTVLALLTRLNETRGKLADLARKLEARP